MDGAHLYLFAAERERRGRMPRQLATTKTSSRFRLSCSGSGSTVCRHHLGPTTTPSPPPLHLHLQLPAAKAVDGTRQQRQQRPTRYRQ